MNELPTHTEALDGLLDVAVGLNGFDARLKRIGQVYPNLFSLTVRRSSDSLTSLMNTVFRLALCFLPFFFTPPPVIGAEAVEQIKKLTEARATPVVLKNGDIITTLASFKPPVEITITAKVDSKNFIMGYAADQIIFNWDGPEPTQLRVEGGPDAHKHKTGAGLLPVKRYFQIRWVVTAKSQEIFVDGDGRYSRAGGDYTAIDRPITISCKDSTVTVRSIKVKQL